MVSTCPSGPINLLRIYSIKATEQQWFCFNLPTSGWLNPAITISADWVTEWSSAYQVVREVLNWKHLRKTRKDCVNSNKVEWKNCQPYKWYKIANLQVRVRFCCLLVLAVLVRLEQCNGNWKWQFREVLRWDQRICLPGGPKLQTLC